VAICVGRPYTCVVAPHSDDHTMAVAIAVLVSGAVGASLVVFRDHTGIGVIVLLLTLTVVFGAAVGGPVGGLAAGAAAAVTFDFWFTKPYLSLKIDSADDVFVTLLLLAVGMSVGLLRSYADHKAMQAATERAAGGGLERVLAAAAAGDLPDVELSVRAELLNVLFLEQCSFTLDRPDVPVMGRQGDIDGTLHRYVRGGFTLPPGGVAVAVALRGRTMGYLVCTPGAGAGVDVSRRRAAVALADALALAIAAANGNPQRQDHG
jgi:hypothetical protein